MQCGFAAQQIGAVDDIVMDEHEIMQEIHAGGGIINRRSDLAFLPAIPFVAEDKEERADAFALTQREFFDAAKKEGIDKVFGVFLLNFVKEFGEAFVDLFSD